LKSSLSYYVSQIYLYRSGMWGTSYTTEGTTIMWGTSTTAEDPK
jgi:hypothetical protein